MNRAVLMAVAAACAGVAPAAWAQSAGRTADPTMQGESALGEIVVTARKREESLVEVPVSITAFTEAAIQQAGIESVADLAYQTPGFSFRQGFGRSGSGDAGASVRPSIRGMSNILGSPNAGFFVDGIFVSGNITSYQLDNLERVEVIKGPQAALFGRGTFAGAINFVTRKPGDELTGRVNVTAGQYDHYEGSGYVVLPLIKGVLSSEINGRVYRFGGDFVNQDNGKRDINAQESTNVGAKLRWTPTENFEAIAQVLYAQDRDKGYSSFLMKNTPQQLNCYLPRIVGTQPGTGFPLAANRTRGYFCGEIESPDRFAYNIDEIEALGYDGVNRETLRTSLALDYGFANGWSVTSISAYNKQDNQNGFDNSYVPTSTPSLTIEGLENHDFSQELRVQTPRDRKFRGMFGGYYFESNDDQGYTVNTTFGNANFGRVSGFNSLDKVENTAVFGLVEWDATDALTVSAEGRYQEDKITGSREVSVLGGIGQPSAVRNTEFKSFLPRVTARYALEAGWNVYGSVAKGNKPGGFNDLPTDANAAAIALFEERNYDEFDEEQVWSYELGTKGQLGRIYFNAAIYYLDWTKQQLTQSQPYQRLNGTFTTFPFITNAGESEIKGLEIEISGPVTTWLDLRLGYSLNDAKFKDFYDVNQEELLDTDGQPSYLSLAERTINPRDVDGPNGQVAGNRLPQTPKHQAIFTADVHFPALTNAIWFLRSDLAYDSKRYVQTHNLAHTGSSINLNLRTGLEWQDVTVTLYVNNATDDDTPLVGTRLFDFNRFLSQPDPNLANPNARRTTFYRDFLVASPRKREVGMTATWKF